jgi:hypothetical protein
MEQHTGLYLVNIDIACEGFVGGPLAALKLVVNAHDGLVYGSGTLGHSGTAPGSGGYGIRNVTGNIHHTGFGTDTLLVQLSGTYSIPFGPTMPGHSTGTFSAALALTKQWEGVGMFTYGQSGESVCADARVSRHEK